MDSILILIPVHNRRELTLRLLDQIKEFRVDNFSFEILVIDDGSSDGTDESVRNKHPEAKIIYGDGNLWWGGSLKLGFEYALRKRHDYVYTVNNDTVLKQDTLINLYSASKVNPRCITSSIAIDELNRILNAGFNFSPKLHLVTNIHKNKKYEHLKEEYIYSETLSTRSTLIPVELFKENIFPDTKHFPHNYSDTDFFERSNKQGFKLMVVTNSVIITEESGSNYHSFIVKKKVGEIFKALINTKYAFNVKHTHILSFHNQPVYLGILRLVRFNTSYLAWLLFRMIFGARITKDVLKNLGRI